MPRAIKGRPRWRRDELDTLCQLATQRTNTQLAELLGRSKAAISCEISLLKLRGTGARTKVKVPMSPQETRDHVQRMMQLSARIAQLKKMKVKAA